MKYKNFDKFIQEQNRETIQFTIYGENYTLPSKPSFKTILKFKELHSRRSEDTLEENYIADLFSLLVGDKTYNSISKNPEFDTETALALMTWILNQYGFGKNEEEEVEGEATAPKGKTKKVKSA